METLVKVHNIRTRARPPGANRPGRSQRHCYGYRSTAIGNGRGEGGRAEREWIKNVTRRVSGLTRWQAETA